MTIKTIDWVKENVGLKRKISKIEIYQDHVHAGNKLGILKVEELRPDENNSFADGLDLFKKSCFGNYTFVLFPSKVQWHVSNFEPGVIPETLNGTEDLNSTEAALVILVEKFGEEWLQKFAAKVQAEPHIVPQIKTFFS